jgi:hypothetical protein
MAVPLSGPPAERIEGRALLAVRAQLFLSAYAPLFVILAFRFTGMTLKGVCGALATLGVTYLALLLMVAKRRGGSQPYTVEVVTDASGEVAGFLASYLLPFVTVPSPSSSDLIGYGIYALVALAIFLRSDLARINPTLYLLGRRVALVQVAGSDRYLICRHLPRVGAEIQAVRAAGLLIQVKGL